jgi:hypothetical protein
MWRAKTPVGYYWKTFDIFTQGYVLFGAWNQRRFDAFTIIAVAPCGRQVAKKEEGVCPLLFAAELMQA